ncbi:short-chain dehydrogenase [Rickenella mellea]|uniref:Short-chain dehydrogenase n=1 Tax=Rickenella mellea TaxID=50990 RepID=A0A4Y7PR41_9AGAM|nr:short-chain dehydrogenase [Rickenella mellea]
MSKLQNMFDLTGHVALVTGAGTGIGLMIAQGLAAHGARVYLAGRRLEVVEKAAASLEPQGSGFPLQLDVTDKASIVSCVKYIEDREGKLHILVNNAGQVGPTSFFLNDKSNAQHTSPSALGQALFESGSFNDWERLFSINISSIYFVTTAFIGLLSRGTEDRISKGDDGYTASVINITSISGILKVAQEHFAYNTSKAAVTHLTKLLSTEFVLNDIPVRVNSIAPGVYASELTATEEQLAGKAATDKMSKAPMGVPAGRAGRAEEIAGTVVFLVSRAGCYTNGQEIVVDGGALTINPSTA